MDKLVVLLGNILAMLFVAMALSLIQFECFVLDFIALQQKFLNKVILEFLFILKFFSIFLQFILHVNDTCVTLIKILISSLESFLILSHTLSYLTF